MVILELLVSTKHLKHVTHLVQGRHSINTKYQLLSSSGLAAVTSIDNSLPLLKFLVSIHFPLTPLTYHDNIIIEIQSEKHLCFASLSCFSSN